MHRTTRLSALLLVLLPLLVLFGCPIGVLPQNGPVLDVNANALSVPATAGSVQVNVTNTGSGTLYWWAEVTSGSWLSVSTSSGTLTIAYDANPDTQPRTGTVCVYGEDSSGNTATNSPICITITQAGTTGSGNCRPINPDDTLRGSLDTPTEEDCFEFQAEDNTVYLVQIDPIPVDSPLLTGNTVRVTDESGFNQWVDEVPRHGTTTYSFVWRSEAAGTHRIYLSNSFGAVGNYEIRLRSLDDDYGDTPEEAELISFESTQRNKPTLTRAGRIDNIVDGYSDTDYFIFDVTPCDLKTTLSIDVVDQAPLDVTLNCQWEDATGTMGALESINNHAAGGGEHAEWNCQETGRLHIWVYEFTGEGGDYQVKITGTRDDHGNDHECATPLTSAITGGCINNSSEAYDDFDYFSFNVDYGQQCTIVVQTAEGAPNGLDVAFLEQDGFNEFGLYEVEVTDSFRRWELTFTADSTGTRYIRVERGLKKVGEEYGYEISTTCSAPDLRVTGFGHSPESYTEGESGSAYANVENSGDFSTPETQAALYLNNEGHSNFISTVDVPALQPGEVQKVTWTFTMPDLDEAEEYQVDIVYELDTAEELDESDEDNSFTGDTGVVVHGAATQGGLAGGFFRMAEPSEAAIYFAPDGTLSMCDWHEHGTYTGEWSEDPPSYTLDGTSWGVFDIVDVVGNYEQFKVEYGGVPLTVYNRVSNWAEATAGSSDPCPDPTDDAPPSDSPVGTYALSMTVDCDCIDHERRSSIDFRVELNANHTYTYYSKLTWGNKRPGESWSSNIEEKQHTGTWNLTYLRIDLDPESGTYYIYSASSDGHVFRDELKPIPEWWDEQLGWKKEADCVSNVFSVGDVWENHHCEWPREPNESTTDSYGTSDYRWWAPRIR